MALRPPQDSVIPAATSPTTDLSLDDPSANTAAADRTIALSDLPIGARGWLLDAAASPSAGTSELSRPSRDRLRNLGFVPGTEIRVLRRAPFGGPIEFELRGFRICLRPGDLGELKARLEP